MLSTRFVRLISCAAVFSLGFTILSFPQLSAQLNSKDWPIVRGNTLQTGVSETTLPADLKTIWTFKADDSFEGAACISGGVVYIGNYDEYLYAIDLKNGKLKWKFKAGPIKASPSAYKGNIYVGDEDGTFYCLDAGSGQKHWSFETNGEIASSANFYKDKIIFGSWDNTLYCLSSDGKLHWKVETEGPVNGSPSIVGNRTFVAGCDSTLHIIDIDTGKEVGAVDLGGQVAGTPAIRGDELYVGTMTEQVLGIDWNKNKVLWAFEPKRRSQAFYASAAVTDKLVIIGSRDRKVYAINRETGKEVWHFETDGKVDPSPVVVGKRVYAPSLDGHLYVFDLNNGRKIEEYQLGRAIAASPAVANHRLVIGNTEGILYCLGAKN